MSATPSQRAKALRARMIAEVRASPSPSREEVARRGAGTVVVAVLVMLATFFAVGGPHATARPHWLVLVTSIAWGAIAMTATRVALDRGRTMLGASRRALLGTGLLVAPLLALAWFMQPSALVMVPVPHAFYLDVLCFTITMALALAPFLAFFILRKEGDPVKPVVTGAATGAAAGAWGAMLIDLHCELTDPRHVLVGHILPVLAFAAMGALVARSTLAVRVSSPP